MLMRRHQRGMSLVELMVGITVGLFVVAAATLLVTMQLGDNRRLLLETQLQQDLRAAADIITREMRRSGSAGSTTVAEQVVWAPGQTTVVANPYADLEIDDGIVSFRYRRGSGVEGPFSFKLENNVVKSLIAGGWQELTDGGIMEVTEFNVTEDAPIIETIACPRLCEDSTTACWPTLVTRTLRLEIRATSTADSTIARSIRSAVRVRNDEVRFNDDDNPLQVCPT